MLDRIEYYQTLIVHYSQQIEDLELENEKLLKENEKLRKENERIQQELDDLIILDVSATHYDAFCDTGCIGITATGYDVSNTIYYDGMRVVAVDPNLIPLGTIMTVHTSYGSFKAIALDTGGAIKGYRIDILEASEREAYKKGIVQAKVVIQNGG